MAKDALQLAQRELSCSAEAHKDAVRELLAEHEQVGEISGSTSQSLFSLSLTANFSQVISRLKTELELAAAREAQHEIDNVGEMLVGRVD